MAAAAKGREAEKVKEKVVKVVEEAARVACMGDAAAEVRLGEAAMEAAMAAGVGMATKVVMMEVVTEVIKVGKAVEADG